MISNFLSLEFVIITISFVVLGFQFNALRAKTNAHSHALVMLLRALYQEGHISTEYKEAIEDLMKKPSFLKNFLGLF